MPDIRPEKVRELVRAASAGMSVVAEGTTANEVFSAYMTMASHGITTAKEMGVPAETLRAILFQMLVNCDDSTLKVM